MFCSGLTIICKRTFNYSSHQEHNIKREMRASEVFKSRHAFQTPQAEQAPTLSSSVIPFFTLILCRASVCQDRVHDLHLPL